LRRVNKLEGILAGELRVESHKEVIRASGMSVGDGVEVDMRAIQMALKGSR
jgi:hypothetical protein